MATVFYLVRHGETDWNRQGRWQAQLDVPLNEAGRRQAAALGVLAARFPLAALYSSDLARAMETARLIAAAFNPGPPPLYPEPRLREFNAGVLAGYTLEELRVLYPEWWEADRRDPVSTRCPGGETFQEMRARVKEALDDIASRHPDRAVGVVTHGGPIRAVVFEVLGLTDRRMDAFAVDNGSLTVVRWSERPCLLALNVGPRWVGWAHDGAAGGTDLDAG